MLSRARRELAHFYPTYADFEPVKKHQRPFEPQPMRLVALREDGTPDIDALNADFNSDDGKRYLADPANPRWLAKPSMAYLWARSVTCKNCRSALPLLKTRWLSKTDNRRVLLAMEPKPDKTGVQFRVQQDVPAASGPASRKKTNDKKLGAGTMTRSGAVCPCCGTIMTMEDIRLEGQAGRMGTILTTVVADGPNGKEFRMPTPEEHHCIAEAAGALQNAFANVPFGLPTEPTPSGGGNGAGRAFSVQGYGLMKLCDLFLPRQLVSLASLVSHTRAARDTMKSTYTQEWTEGLSSYLAAGLDRLLDFANCGVTWKSDVPTINHSFARFALPITWDFTEGNPIGDMAGSYKLCFERICTGFDTFGKKTWKTPAPHVQRESATKLGTGSFDAIVTDPPYYDSIPYSDLMDFFYVWLRRMLSDTTPEFSRALSEPLAPKWNHDANDGELIDDSSRHNGDATKSKSVYEDGMFRAFQACHRALTPEGRLVVVFANKQPDAWETLVSAIIRAGFVVDGSWPIQTEQPSRMRGIASAALASSVWLVCKKRVATASAGWDKEVLDRMRRNIRTRLNEVLGCRHPRTRLRLGRHRPGHGSLQPARPKLSSQPSLKVAPTAPLSCACPVPTRPSEPGGAQSPMMPPSRMPRSNWSCRMRPS